MLARTVSSLASVLCPLLEMGVRGIGILAAEGPLPPAEAPRHMTVPQGFKVTLFAGEPDVVQPIAFSFDDRGRLWVVECLSYPAWVARGERGSDRVVIFEDRDGDGRFDERRVFLDEGRNLSGIEIGFGGVWLCSTPELVFVPDRDGDDRPDGPPVPVLDGWDLEAKHNVFNGLAWGPDGWLYGLNGILSNSRVGAPGTPDAGRVALNCGVWRYHPVRRAFEAVAHGTTNPWGIDFDDLGRIVITNCVIEHVWHVVPGAHFERMFGQDLDPHVYRLLKSGADHIHWAGGPWQSSRGGSGAHGTAGGGHAHSGCMVYLGDNWPEAYRGDVFLCNLHGARLNRDAIEPRGSTVAFRHREDFLLTNDSWFRGLVVKYGPDGGVYVADWNDTGECHDYDEVRRESGRIFKVTHGEPVRWTGDLARLADGELVKLQLHRNDWLVRHARRILEERAAQGRLSSAVRPALLAMLRGEEDVPRKLRALWALHAAGGLDEEAVTGLLESPHEHLRAWALALELDDAEPSRPILDKLAAMARGDPSPVVRLRLASALGRLPIAERWPIAEGLVSHAEDAGDLYLPLRTWYAVEPLAGAEGERAAHLLERTSIPLVREHLARRIASPDILARLLERAGGSDGALELDVLRGLHEALRGRRAAPMPASWPAVAQRIAKEGAPEARELAVALSLLFGDPEALASLRRALSDAATSAETRERALAALLQKRDPALPPILHGLAGAPGRLRAPAIRALAAFDHPLTPKVLLSRYPSLTDAEKQDALGTLASRPAYAILLLDAVAKGSLPRRDLSAYTARQIASLGSEGASRRLAEVWGEIRSAAGDKTELFARYKALLATERTGDTKEAARSRGRRVFERTCASCHKLFGEGGSIGPELTGAQRTNADYILENLLDPSAAVARDYQMTVIVTTDGRVLTGIIKEENENAATVQTANEGVVVPIGEIASRERSPLSMMPEDLLTRLPDDEVRDLIAYLSGEAQAPPPESGPR